MPDIVVQRGAANAQGIDVIDALLSSDLAALSRGQMELDDNSGLRPSTIDVLYRPGLRTGMVVEIYDPLVSGLRYGKIASISHTLSRVGVDSRIKVMVPSEFVV